MSTRIRFRRDTAANWTSVDPVMALGEVGIETDTSKLKVGDGATAWTALGYVFGDDFTDLDTRLDDLEALPIATRCIDDSTDSTSTTGAVRIFGQRTAVTLTTKVLSADTVYAVSYEPTADELHGRSVLSAIAALTTSGGDLCHLGIWVIDAGYPLTLVADSGALSATGAIAWAAPGFVPENDKLYAVGIVVNVSTTVRALSNNACAMLGLDAGFGTSPYSHYQCAMTYGALTDFNTPTMSTGTVPAIGGTYTHP